ncbi:M23 family metallopeptidase [Stakelama marina]|uniref:M23 family metallopeptidase n=1 Tax=Stakelama marina TaxID=2826939 RepID=UPI0024C345C2|nr:M23 family metallopeptidase [Stakelama marina]
MIARFQKIFTTRDFIFHDGRELRRFSLSGRKQALMGAVAAVTVCFSAYGVTSATAGAIAASGVMGDQSPEARLARMQTKVASIQADMATIREAAATRAARVEQRQAMIAAVLSGKGHPSQLAAVASADETEKGTPIAAKTVAPFDKLEGRQIAFAVQARKAAEARYDATAAHLRQLGLKPERFAAAMGGPYEPVSATEEAAQHTADAQFRSLFNAWKKLDTLEKGVISIPSLKPVEHVTFSSTFGVRTDPFRGTSAMHAGVDIPGPKGTPVYATADGIIDRAGRAGGYGNMVEIDHGRGIETRYGHLSKILVKDNQRVHRGDLIALMGSTGRSTGSHLHYEVRIDGHAVNPMPYLKTTSDLVAIQDRAQANQQLASVGGPAS